MILEIGDYMKDIFNKILKLTVILSLFCILVIVGWLVFNSIKAYQGYNYCPGFFCEEVRYYTELLGILAFFRDQVLFLFFIVTISGILPLISLPLCTYINIKLFNKLNSGFYLLIPLLIPVVLLIIGLFEDYFKLLALFAGIYCVTFIISYFVGKLYKKIFN